MNNQPPTYKLRFVPSIAHPAGIDPTSFLRVARGCLFTGLLIPGVCLASETMIDQSGNSSSAIIDQYGVGTEVSADIIQNGEYQEAYILQESNEYSHLNARIVQSDMNNLASVEQLSIELGEAEILQAGAGNQVTVLQQTNMDGRNLQVNVNQEGDANSVFISQNVEDTAIANVSQVGDGNVAQFEQGAGVAPSDYGAEIHLSVAGNDNFESVYQSQTWALGYVELVYSGDNNFADIQQLGETPELTLISENSSHNTDTIYQSAGGTQTIGVNRINSDYSSVNIHQSGYYYDASVDQSNALESSAEIQQLDDLAILSSATIIQADVNGALAYIEQQNVGEAVLEQQNVENSEARILQSTSFDAYAYIRQYSGDSNYAEIQQLATMDCCDYSASIEQSGVSNFASIIQSAGADSVYGIVPTAAITQSGSDNHAAISQM